MDIGIIGPIAITALVVAGLIMISFILYASWLAPTYQFNQINSNNSSENNSNSSTTYSK